MREGVELRLRPGDREQLDGVISDRKSPQHHVWRARTVLMTANGAGTMAIRAAAGRQADDLALAGALHVGRCRRPVQGRLTGPRRAFKAASPRAAEIAVEVAARITSAVPTGASTAFQVVDAKPPITPVLIRRSGVPLSGAALLACPGRRVEEQSAAPAPRQTEGPFYPTDWTGDADTDLVRVAGEAARAQGVATHLRGRVLDAACAPVPFATVEIWQCDASGRDQHPRDRQDGRDPGSRGGGRVVTGPDGSCAFRTIGPFAYPGRTPDIHAAVAVPGRSGALVTQFYVARGAERA